jgi:HPt (histidine-containing phosphotransfer) domain-containing protein
MSLNQRQLGGHSSAANAPIDVRRLAAISASSHARRDHLLRLFVEEIDRDLARLAAAQTLESWQDAAHALKSSGASIGAHRLTTLADAAQYLTEQAWESDRDDHFTDLQSATQMARRHAVDLLAAPESACEQT